MKNPNAIWFQTKDNLFAQVMRLGDGGGNEYYRFEVYAVYDYPKYYQKPKKGKITLKGNAVSLPLAKKEVLQYLTGEFTGGKYYET